MHVQVNVLPEPEVHVPPFWHGLLSHALVVPSHVAPLKPGAHKHLNPDTPRGCVE